MNKTSLFSLRSAAVIITAAVLLHHKPDAFGHPKPQSAPPSKHLLRNIPLRAITHALPAMPAAQYALLSRRTLPRAAIRCTGATAAPRLSSGTA